MPRFYYESGWVHCRAALQAYPLRTEHYVRQCLMPIATRLLWRHTAGRVSTRSRDLQQIE